MFIPTWLLVVAAVVLLLVFSRALGWVLLLFMGIIVLGSGLLGQWYLMKQEYGLAALVGAPFLLVALWVGVNAGRKVWNDNGRLQVNTLRTLLWLHGARVKRMKNPVAVMNASIALAQRIRLGEVLFKLYDHIQHFPAWYKSPVTYPEASRWSSNVIPAAAIRNVPVAEVVGFGIEESKENAFGEWLLYSFSAKGKDYVLCGHSDRGSASGDSAYRVYVVELPDRRLLEVRLDYGGDAYTDFFRSDHVECFRPGEWVVTLYQTAERVHSESDASYQAWSARYEADRAKKFS